MTTAHDLAHLTAGSTMEQGSGGIPELTREDVLTALGFTSYRVPRSEIGMNLVLAKYTDCPIAINSLEGSLPPIAWALWFRGPFRGAVCKDTVTRITHLAIYDFCEPIHARRSGTAGLANAASIGHKKWIDRYSKFYGTLLAKMSALESPIYRRLYWALNGEE